MARKWKAPVHEPRSARAYVAVSFDDKESYERARKELEGFFGASDFESQAFTTQGLASLYGDSIRRHIRFISFKRPVGRDELVDLRRKTMSIESSYQADGRPLMELDPGYVSEFNVVRSALEDDFHRIYLFHGIYGETLFYFENHGFRPLIILPTFFAVRK